MYAGAVKTDVVTDACGVVKNIGFVSSDDSKNIVGKEPVVKSWSDFTRDEEQTKTEQLTVRA